MVYAWGHWVNAIIYYSYNVRLVYLLSEYYYNFKYISFPKSLFLLCLFFLKFRPISHKFFISFGRSLITHEHVCICWRLHFVNIIVIVSPAGSLVVYIFHTNIIWSYHDIKLMMVDKEDCEWLMHAEIW